ncbi:MAG: ABC transporter ATP-binding protein [Bacilli bacterium]|nr:ABC transporter ATP-binding protein [Bacilli bacterium]
MKEFIQSLKFTWKYAKKEKGRIILFGIANLFNVTFSILIPMIDAKIIIELTTNHFERLIFMAICLTVNEVLYDLFDFLSRRLSVVVYHHTLEILGMDLGKNILKLENNSLDEHGSGAFIQRMTGDTDKLADVFNYLVSMFSSLVKYIGILIAIFIVNKIVFLFTLIILIIRYFIERARTNRRKKDDEISRKAKDSVSSFTGELVRGARDIKMLNSENDFMKEMNYRIKDFNEKRIRMQNISWNYRVFGYWFTDISFLLLIILLAFLIKDKVISISIAMVLYNYVGNVGGSTYLLGDLLEYIKDFNLSCERVKEIIDGVKFKKEQFGEKHLDKVEGHFTFDHVFFKYKEKEVLKNLTFEVKPNETVAFVGKSGAGKTTIFNLLCKMYDVNQGKITIDGVNISELDKDSIRGNITIISQNPYIFNMSIRDNLKLVKNDLSDEEMYNACKIACLDDFIQELPNGYDTIIGEGGVNLSGGQKQRLAIARALVQKTEIILFDEATSALDNETQEKIQRAIENMKNEYTILIIAHRLSTIIHADRILYLEDGKIIAQGTHHELLKNCPSYQKLYESEIKKDE